jgi:MFS family permease
VFFFNLLGRGSGETYAVFLLPLEREFGWSRSQLTSVFSVYLLIGGFIAPLVGTLFDRVGPRWVYLVGLLALGLANFLASTTTTLVEFYIYVGAIVGIGVALVGMVPASGLLVRWYRARLSTAIGLAFTAAGCGTLVFVPFAQMMLDASDWRTTYRTIGIAFLAMAPLLALLLPWRRFATGHPDFHKSEKASSGDGGWTLQAASRTPFYRGLAVMFCLTSMSMFIVLPQSVAYFIDSGFTPVVAASAYGITSVMSVISVTITGYLSDRIGPRPVITASYMGTGLGMVVLFIMSFHPVAFLLTVYVVMFGLCQGVRAPIISAMCARRFAGPRVATIYGTLYALNAVGAAIGAFTGGLLHDITGGYRTGFVVAIVILLCSALPIWLVKELRVYR